MIKEAQATAESGIGDQVYVPNHGFGKVVGYHGVQQGDVRVMYVRVKFSAGHGALVPV